ncbi:predicted protein [Methanosarcina acetivorans C2A]|uniref:Uncharacterized protein n=1 Tax=Methanosarcina acetivorans (strain ATCC 35395 / DSM 2834 / JCM 12185 / C2A) TaxID=188937 RepID=Q8TKZ2_METAC|nr:predicted protein [Methanosarcina acetivorans C2A]
MESPADINWMIYFKIYISEEAPRYNNSVMCSRKNLNSPWIADHVQVQFDKTCTDSISEKLNPFFIYNFHKGAPARKNPGDFPVPQARSALVGIFT